MTVGNFSFPRAAVGLFCSGRGGKQGRPFRGQCTPLWCVLPCFPRLERATGRSVTAGGCLGGSGGFCFTWNKLEPLAIFLFSNGSGLFHVKQVHPLAVRGTASGAWLNPWARAWFFRAAKKCALQRIKRGTGTLRGTAAFIGLVWQPKERQRGQRKAEARWPRWRSFGSCSIIDTWPLYPVPCIQKPNLCQLGTNWSKCGL